MGKEMKSKLMPVLLVLVLISSAVVIIPQSTIADPFVYPRGFAPESSGLTCGEEVTYSIRNDSLNESRDYVLWITNDSTVARNFVNSGGPLGTTYLYELEDGAPTRYGDIAITFNVPSEDNLGVDPTEINNGDWTLILQDEESGLVLSSNYDRDINIANLYTLKVKYDDDWVDYLLYNFTYTPIYFYVYQWTGSKLELLDDVDFNISIRNADGGLIASQDGITTGIWDLDITDDDLSFRNEATDNLEVYLPVQIEDPDGHITNTAFPLLLQVTSDYPEDAEWGDTLTVTGYVYDGQGEGIGDYNVALFAPVNGSYTLAATTETYSTGRYSLSVETGYDVYPDSYSPGTWYIGTWDRQGDPVRVNESDKFEHPIQSSVGFLRYYWFDVAGDDTAEIDIKSPDQIIDGFNQTINVTVEWNGEPFDNYDNDEDSADGPAWVHIHGIEAYDYGDLDGDGISGEEIDEDDYYVVGHTNLWDDNDTSSCEFTIMFNETGTGTIVVTWPYNGDIYFFDQYNNSDYGINISGTLNFNVGSADEMNMVVENMVDEVLIDDVTCGWRNETTGNLPVVEITVYGDEEDDEMNASIHVSGCGLDYTIDEDDEVDDNDYLVSKDDGEYGILISPKTGGVLTITATNETDNMSVSKDFSIKGLTGSVITSINDDDKISVKTPETITFTVANGEYAEVQLGYWDENWDAIDCKLYSLEGDGVTEGEGLNGVYEFDLEEEDIEDGVGYLVAVAHAADRWMYEVIELEPLHDLTVEIIAPLNWTTSDAFTVGYDHEDVELRVLGPDGEIMDDIDEVWAVLTDEDNDEDHPLQRIDFKERSGSVWVPDDDLQPWFTGELIITAKNNSGENEHDGNISFVVDFASMTYSPDGVTAGLDLEDFEVTVTAMDANGEPLPEGVELYLWIENNTGGAQLADSDIILDEDGIGEFTLSDVGDLKTLINITLDDNDWEDGNATAGKFMIDWPVFELDPDTIFIGLANTVTITATDYADEPVEGLNLTLWTGGTSFGTPDPVETDADGQVEFSIQPEASGKANVTIVRGIEYVNGVLQWNINDSIITDTYLTITAVKTMKISVSQSPVYEGDTLTATVTSGAMPVAGADVEFAGTTVATNADGEATFTVPDPGVEVVIYTINAEKTGYVPADITISVIKVYDIVIVGPSAAPAAGETFTVTVIAKGQPLAGATATFNGKDYTSDGDGKVSLTAPSGAGDYVITATFPGYGDATYTITIGEGGVPGFELLTLIAALGVAFIILRRRR